MIENKARIAANGGTIATSVLIYMALHDDDALRFSTKRLNAITDTVITYSEDINHSAEKFILYRNRLDQCGIDFQLKYDFIRALMKGLKFSGKREHTGAEAGIEATYTLILLAAHDIYMVWAGRACAVYSIELRNMHGPSKMAPSISWST